MACQRPVRGFTFSLGEVHSAVADVDPLDHQHTPVQLDLATSVSHQTGGINSPGPQGSGERSRQSTGGSAHNVVQRGRVLGIRALGVPVVVAHRTVCAVEHRLLLRRQVGPPQRSTPTLDPHLGHVDDLTHAEILHLPIRPCAPSCLAWLPPARCRPDGIGAASGIRARAEAQRPFVHGLGRPPSSWTRHAGGVHVLIRRYDLATMSDYLAQRLIHHEWIVIHPRSEIFAVCATSGCAASPVGMAPTQREASIAAAWLFLMIWTEPRTNWLRDTGVELDAKGSVVTTRRR